FDRATAGNFGTPWKQPLRLDGLGIKQHYTGNCGKFDGKDGSGSNLSLTGFACKSEQARNTTRIENSSPSFDECSGLVGADWGIDQRGISSRFPLSGQTNRDGGRIYERRI